MESAYRKKQGATASRQGKSTQSSTLATPGATASRQGKSTQPSATPTTASSILANAVNPDVEKAVFSSVEGDLIIDPAAMPSAAHMQNRPRVPNGGTRTSILEGSKDAKATFAIFSSVQGNQYGFPQSQFNANTAAAVKPTTQWSEESESLR